MNSKEQNVREALQELESLLGEGMSVDAALSLAVEDIDLRSDVLKARAAKAFGNLEQHSRRLANARSLRELKRAIDGAAEMFVEEGKPWIERRPETEQRLREFIEHELKRPISSFEFELAKEAEASARARKHAENLQCVREMRERLAVLRENDA